jgi:hypothetical protein
MGRIYKSIMVRNGAKSEYITAFVDSGADISLISERLARRLRLKMGGPGFVKVADGRVIPTKTGRIWVEEPNERVKFRLTVEITNLPFDEDIDILDMIIGIDFLQETESMLEFHHSGKRSLCRAKT